MYAVGHHCYIINRIVDRHGGGNKERNGKRTMGIIVLLERQTDNTGSNQSAAVCTYVEGRKKKNHPGCETEQKWLLGLLLMTYDNERQMIMTMRGKMDGRLRDDDVQSHHHHHRGHSIYIVLFL